MLFPVQSLVLNVKLLENELKVTENEVNEMRQTRKLYSFLDSKRKALYGRKRSAGSDRVQEAENIHYRTALFKEQILQNKAPRDEIISFLEEMNGLPRRSVQHKKPFDGNDLKHRLMEERARRAGDFIQQVMMRNRSLDTTNLDDSLQDVKPEAGPVVF